MERRGTRTTDAEGGIEHERQEPLDDGATFWWRSGDLAAQLHALRRGVCPLKGRAR